MKKKTALEERYVKTQRLKYNYSVHSCSVDIDFGYNSL